MTTPAKPQNNKIPKDARKLFDEQVPKALENYPDKAREVAAIYSFNITGDGGGEWTVDLKSDPPTCVKGDQGSAECSIEITHDDFKHMLSDPEAGMQLYFEGKLKVTGDPMLATKLQQLFRLGA
jgi:putative sterol carrier protein